MLGSGADIFVGGSGNDFVEGGAGADQLSGGAGVDTVSYDGSSAGVTVRLTPNLFTGGGDASGDRIDGFENIFGSSFNDTLIGYKDANRIEGGFGADYLDGLAGDDTLIGGAGNDRIRGGLGDDFIQGDAGADQIDGGDGVDTVSYAANVTGGVVVSLIGGPNTGGAAQGDTILNVENLVGTNLADVFTGSDLANDLDGQAGADTLDGQGGADLLTGDEGADLLRGGAGADTIDGGDGVDTASYTGSAAGVTVDLGTGVGAGGDAAGDLVLNVENLIGSGFGDTLTATDDVNYIDGGAGADKLFGLGGDDILIGGAGADTIDGGGGVDTLSYDGSSAAVLVRLWNGTGVGGDADGDVISNVEFLIGSSFADTLIGGNGTGDTLVGGAGKDYLDGLSGDDRLDGGADDDRLIGGLGADTLDGGGGNDSMAGGDNADVFLAGAGADTMDGGTGVDVLTYAASPSGVTARLDNVAGVGGDAAGDKAVNIETLIGSGFADMLIGSALGDSLVGGAGVDTLAGGLGFDTLNGGSGEGDFFLFDSALGSTNVDLIEDFVHLVDKIEIDDAVFTALSARLSGGALAPSQFEVNFQASSAATVIVYNSLAGTIAYDADGAGGVAAVVFAQITPRTNLTADDFLIV